MQKTLRFGRWILASFLILYTVVLLFVETVGDQYLVKTLRDTLETEFNVQVDVGAVDHGVLNILNVKIRDIHVQYQGQTVIQTEKLHIKVSPYALLRKTLEVKSISMDVELLQLNALFMAHIASLGEDSEQLEATAQKPVAIPFNKIEISSFDLSVEKAIYQDVEVDAFALSTQPVSMSSFDDVLSTMALDVSIQIQKVTHPYAVIEDCNIDAKLKQSRVEIPSFECQLFEEPITISAAFDIDPMLRNLAFAMAYHDMELDRLTSYMGSKLAYPVTGKLDIQMDIEVDNIEQWTGTKGSVKLQGKEVTVKNINLDKLIDAYLKSNKTSLLNVAGFMTLGPVGILVTQSAKLGKSIPGLMGGETFFKDIYTEVVFDKDFAECKDVALSTQNHRVAVDGSVNLKEKTYKDFKLGFLNEEGCAVLVQKVEGPLDKPSFGIGSSFLKTIAAPVTHIAGKVGKVVKGGCETFYTGSVKHP